MSQAWRDLTNSERQLIELLLAKEFPGAEALRSQLETAKVSAIDAEGSLHLGCRVHSPMYNSGFPRRDITSIRKVWIIVLP